MQTTRYLSPETALSVLALALPRTDGLLGPIGHDVSMLEADGWWCSRPHPSPTPGSLGASDKSLINDLITAEALKGARGRARVPNAAAKLPGN